MIVTPMSVPDVKLIQPRVFSDSRGYFFETFLAERYEHAGVRGPFVQDNVSSSHRHVLRGLHLQWPGEVQGKLVSAYRGTIWDVAVDVRVGSPTFGHSVGAELSEENHCQLWVPPGFAHGFVVISESALVSYKCTAPHSPRDEVSIRWNDPTLAVRWPSAAPTLSERDAAAPFFADLPPSSVPQYIADSRG